MATEKSQYRVSLLFKIEDMDKTEEPMAVSDNVWAGLDYPSLVTFEAELLDGITGALKKLGLAGLEMATKKAK